MSWKNPWYNPQLSHHLPDGFRNPEPSVRQPGAVKRWRRNVKRSSFQNLPLQATPLLYKTGGSRQALAAAMTVPGGWDMPACY